MTRRQRNDAEAACFSAAAHYLPSLRRLLGLPFALDALLRDSKADVLLIRATIREEKQRLKHVDHVTAISLDAGGGRLGARIEIQRKQTEKQSAPDDSAVRNLIEMIVLHGAERSAIYGTDCLPPDLSEQEKQVLINYVQGDQNSAPQQSNNAAPGPQLLKMHEPSVDAFEKALAECDIATIAREFRDLSGYFLELENRLASEFDRPNAKLGSINDAPRDMRRMYAARILETDRCGLIRVAMHGLVRCLGGPQLLLLQAAQVDDATRAPRDPRVSKILERVSKGVMAQAIPAPLRRDD